jgi:ribosomal protein S18 acetylase RimI-like enzyme
MGVTPKRLFIMYDIVIRSLISNDTLWLRDFLVTHWGSPLMASRGRLFDVSTHAGWVATNATGEILGLITYHILTPDSIEITCLESRQESQGIGTRLIETLLAHARAQAWPRVWLITTNDNTNALRFYQKRGFVLNALYPNAIEGSRRLKPEIPLVGFHNISIRDEIELVYNLA